MFKSKKKRTEDLVEPKVAVSPDKKSAEVPAPSRAVVGTDAQLLTVLQPSSVKAEVLQPAKKVAKAICMWSESGEYHLALTEIDVVSKQLVSFAKLKQTKSLAEAVESYKINSGKHAIIKPGRGL